MSTTDAPRIFMATPRRQVHKMSIPRVASTRVLCLILMLVAVGAASTALVPRPALVVGGLLSAAALVAMIMNIRLAVLFYVAAEPFSSYLASLSGSAVKIIGALMFVAWAVRLLRDRRPAQLRHVVVFGAAALFLTLIASLALHPNGSAGLTTTTRYLSYLGALVVLTDTLRSGLTARRLVAVFTLSCTAAAVAGLITFIARGGRAGGPIHDPNDFAFYLICALPFALMLSRGSHRSRHLFKVCAVILLVATLATLSRGALVGLAAMLVLAIILGLVSARMILAGAAVLIAAVGMVWVLAPSLITSSFDQKAYVASANVNDRYLSWTVAGEMLADNPVLGRGPGGFQIGSMDYATGVADRTHLDVAHEMYLAVGSDLGLLGLTAFLTVLGGGVVGSARALRDPNSRPMATAVCVSFAGTLTAALFLSEQYFLPVWLLASLGAALDPLARRGSIQ